MLLIEGLRSLQRPTYLQTPIGGHHHQLRSWCSQKIMTVLLDYQELEAAHIESSGCQYKIIDHIIVMHWRDKETNGSDMNALER